MTFDLGQLCPVFDLDNLCEFSDQDNKVELALEAISCAVDVKTFGWLFASLNEVIHDLDFDLQLVFKDRPE